jgi:hypothetical protein
LEVASQRNGERAKKGLEKATIERQSRLEDWSGTNRRKAQDFESFFVKPA